MNLHTSPKEQFRVGTSPNRSDMASLSILKLIACLNLVLILGGCQTSSQPRRLTISAASSLQDVLERLEPQFEARYPQIDLSFNFAASGVLQRQIERGAPVDLFFSAATQPMERLTQDGWVVPHSRRDLITNRLVLIVPQHSRRFLDSFEQLPSAHIRKIMVGEFSTVPAGQYAQEVLSRSHLLAKVQPKLIFASNVRGVLAAVASANVDAGIVYQTDAQQSSQVKQVATASVLSHSPIVYPIAIVTTSAQPQAAQSLINFLSTPTAQQTFTQFGFGRVIKE
ncbi:molybdate ABC transporter substrate-binding protein [Acaryochloris sp. IP29b_bin.148]|uniref:molybdate ABC transporter substrate-binding protein n=1 Tax=Acaryochloris sp. IP29b_bin.148 TaxID=2969218 RepID=UPI00261E1C1E|nr:molybdate ABC transporter substrate-binding protein [Acaryochloris sp. IP29b_bin.148]